MPAITDRTEMDGSYSAIKRECDALVDDRDIIPIDGALIKEMHERITIDPKEKWTFCHHAPMLLVLIQIPFGKMTSEKIRQAMWGQTREMKIDRIDYHDRAGFDPRQTWKALPPRWTEGKLGLYFIQEQDGRLTPASSSAETTVSRWRKRPKWYAHRSPSTS